jgi:hypothetical protein
MANTFITLNDTPSSYTGQGAKYLQVDGNEGNVIFNEIALSNLADTTLPAPGGGQVLRYSAGSGKWKAETYNPYSAGNGINLGGTGYVINAVAGSGGGLTANSSGIFITDVATAGVYGNATHIPTITINEKGQVTTVALNEASVLEAQGLNADYVGNVIGTAGQITVSGGTGKNSNASLNLVATGVTSGVYGNTTHIPQITVDTYGRIQNVDMVNVTGNVSGGSGAGGNVQLAYKNIAVSGQTTLSADQAEDTLTFEGGTGFDWTTTPSEDKITVSANTTALAGLLELSGLNDVDATGITNGQVLIWNSSTSKFEAGDQTGSGGGSNVTLTDFSVVTNSPSGNGALSYDNAGVFTFTPANVSSGGDVTQSLSWNASSNQLSISSGNTVDLGQLDQTLSISGNTITISGSHSNVDLTSALGSVAGNYGNSEVQTYLDAQGYSNVDSDAQNLSWNSATSNLSISGGNNVDLSALEQTFSISGNVITISGNNDTVDLTTALSVYQTSSAATTANTNMKAYVDAEINTLIGGANVNLDSLGEVANALANSNTELSTVAFTGTYSDLQTRPTIGLSGSDLTYDGTTLDLSGVGAQGPQGPQGNTGSTGATGIGITDATVTSNDLILTYSNTSVQNLGNIRGPIGPQGADSTVAGPQGDTGPQGVSVNGAALSGDNLILTLSNSSTIDAGNVRGAQGPQGAQGPAGNNGSGDVDQTLSISGNVITISGNNDTVDLTTMLAPYSKTEYADSDVEAYLSGGDGIDYSAGNVAVDSTVVRTTGAQTIAGDKTLTGSTTIGGIGSSLSIEGTLNAMEFTVAGVHVRSLAGGLHFANSNTWASNVSFGNSGNLSIDTGNTIIHGITYPKTDGTSGQVLQTDGNGTLSFATVSGGGGATALDDLSDVSTSGVSSGQVLKYNGSSWAPAADNNSGGGGGSGATVERFKINYDSSGSVSSISNTTSGITSVAIDSASTGDLTLNFDSTTYNYPPASVVMYGYDYTNNKYNMVPLETTMTVREIAGGGSSGSPTLFNGAGAVSFNVRMSENETGSSKGSGFPPAATHAWVQIVMYD